MNATHSLQKTLRCIMPDADAEKFNSLTDLFEALVKLDSDGRHTEELLIDVTDSLAEVFDGREAEYGYRVEFVIYDLRKTSTDPDSDLNFVATLDSLHTVGEGAGKRHLALFKIRMEK